MSFSTPAYHLQDDSEAGSEGSAETLENDSLLPKEEAIYPEERRKLLFRLGLSFFIFGLINDVLFVIILSAALDLVPPSTPKGIIAFCNVAPGFSAKLGWSFIMKGRIRYRARMISCCVLSVLGMFVVSVFNSLGMRLLGIALASCSSGLGELTFLQLSTTYHPLFVAGHAVGYFASGTGGAGLVGAGLWWFLRSLGVRVGIGISGVLPLIIPLTYTFLLPSTLAFTSFPARSDEDDTEAATTSAAYMSIPAGEDDDMRLDSDSSISYSSVGTKVSLTPRDKWILVKPLLLKFMLPLLCVFLFEYTINQGIAPTLVYPVPSPMSDPILSHIITSTRDYYPLWQLVYQSTVFLSRSTLSLGIPPLPSRLLPLPAIIQATILITLVFESTSGIFDMFGGGQGGWNIVCVFLLISVEGICGGLAYVNTFYHAGQEQRSASTAAHLNPERARQEREFKIGSIGFSDQGILWASIIAVPMEVQLCKAQLRSGKMFCKEL